MADGRAALGFTSGSGAAGTVPAAVATLAERVLKMMFLTRLTLIVAALMAAGMARGRSSGLDRAGRRIPRSRSAQAGSG